MNISLTHSLTYFYSLALPHTSHLTPHTAHPHHTLTLPHSLPHTHTHTNSLTPFLTPSLPHSLAHHWSHASKQNNNKQKKCQYLYFSCVLDINNIVSFADLVVCASPSPELIQSLPLPYSLTPPFPFPFLFTVSLPPHSRVC